MNINVISLLWSQVHANAGFWLLSAYQSLNLVLTVAEPFVAAEMKQHVTSVVCHPAQALSEVQSQLRHVVDHSITLFQLISQSSTVWTKNSNNFTSTSEKLIEAAK